MSGCSTLLSAPPTPLPSTLTPPPKPHPFSPVFSLLGPEFVPGYNGADYRRQRDTAPRPRREPDASRWTLPIRLTACSGRSSRGKDNCKTTPAISLTQAYKLCEMSMSKTGAFYEAHIYHILTAAHSIVCFVCSSDMCENVGIVFAVSSWTRT